jgi:hypothetical protein
MPDYKIVSSNLLIRKEEVEECDATNVERNDKAGHIKKNAGLTGSAL